MHKSALRERVCVHTVLICGDVKTVPGRAHEGRTWTRDPVQEMFRTFHMEITTSKTQQQS